MSFKLTYTPDLKLPETWAEVAALDRMWKVRACRAFLRLAAVKLCDVAGLHHDDVVALFGDIPAWISSAKHAYKRAQDKPWAWRCNEEGCNHIGGKLEFFKKGKQYAVCPKCGRMNAQEVQGVLMPPPEEGDGHPPAEMTMGGSHDMTEITTDGHECPVCHGMGKTSIIADHYCETCGTIYCVKCHGVATAAMSRAFDSCARCKCLKEAQYG